jgi:hypothetical protein
MTDLEYEQSMMIMQQQLEMQQMQLRRMQQQRALQRQSLPLESSGDGMSPDHEGHLRSYEAPVPVPQGMPQDRAGPSLQRHPGYNNHAQAQGNNNNGLSYGTPQATAETAPTVAAHHHNNHGPNHNTRVHAAGVAASHHKMTSATGSTTMPSAAPREAPDANARKPKRTLSMTRPERTSSGLSGLQQQRNNGAGNDNGELTLEEYRQQLEEYISNNQIDSNKDPLAEDDEEGGSDLEDDWEKERERHLRQPPSRGVSRAHSRGVDRTKSGASFMSMGTQKSNAQMSMVSGLSNLSDLMSADETDANRERKALARTVSGQSNLSMMSELTDLSANIDNLSLYED